MTLQNDQPVVESKRLQPGVQLQVFDSTYLIESKTLLPPLIVELNAIHTVDTAISICGTKENLKIGENRAQRPPR
ncbi:hypothetical protein F6453_1426 [Marinobacter nauticus]|uniref:Uncharacterized protein n=1 Tax=Marinobacter nauticus TaxID=2743 RepID=A0A833JU70_MARNT|nr:hypothetical protein F6453_1426 [Marinobacter nauticus]